MEKLIALHVVAPPKPAVGAACNGCGVCCAMLPCPLSRALLKHRAGTCPALTWQADESRYACGLVLTPVDYLRWLPNLLVPLARRLVLRWIAVGYGCDCDAEIT